MRIVVLGGAGKMGAGVHPPGLAFDPEPFLDELRERDIETPVTATTGL